MTTQLQKFDTQLQEIAAYAKGTGFNIETGNFDQLMKDWIEHGRMFKVAVDDNSKDFKRIIKRLI